MPTCAPFVTISLEFFDNAPPFVALLSVVLLLRTSRLRLPGGAHTQRVMSEDCYEFVKHYWASRLQKLSEKDSIVLKWREGASSLTGIDEIVMIFVLLNVQCQL